MCRAGHRYDLRPRLGSFQTNRKRPKKRKQPNVSEPVGERVAIAAADEARYVPGVVDVSNSTETLLDAHATFTGTPVDATTYRRVAVKVHSDVTSAPAGLRLQSGATPDFSAPDREEAFTYSPRTAREFTAHVYGPYVRVVYTNGPTAQASFVLTAGLQRAAEPRHDAPIARVIPFKLAEDHDSFGCVRTSRATTLFASQFQYGDDSEIWETQLVGGGTTREDLDNAAVQLVLSGVQGDRVRRQTHAYHRYQPGKSQLLKLTFDLANHVAASTGGAVARVGYFDNQCGVFLEHDAVDGAALVLRNLGVERTRVPQAEWNQDPMDGTGPSLVALDFSRSQLLVMDLTWLSTGQVRVAFRVGGTMHYVHVFNHANRINGAYMTTANLPVRCEYEHVGATTNVESSFLQICCMVASEGGEERDPGAPFSASSGTDVTEIATPTTPAPRVPVLSIRPKLVFNTVPNRARIVPLQLHAYALGGDAYVEVLYNATLSGGTATWTSVGANSLAEYRREGATPGSVVGGRPLFGFYVTADKASSTSSGDLLVRVPLTLNLDGTVPDTFVVVARPISATNSCVLAASVVWHEIR